MTGAPSSEQLETLLNYLEEHNELARGFLRSAEGRVRSRRMWEQLAEQLNSIGGAHKTVKQWQKVWSDKKYLTKRAAAASRNSTSSTGGGPSSASVLTDTEQRIINIMGEGYGEPDTGVAVPAFVDTTPMVYEELPPPELPHPQEIVIEELILDHQNPQEAGVPSVATIQSPRPQRRERVRPTVRRTRAVPQDRSIRSRFIEMEENRVAAEVDQTQELRSIRQALETLVNLFQNYLNRS